jgi:hypothetical protein
MYTNDTTKKASDGRERRRYPDLSHERPDTRTWSRTEFVHPTGPGCGNCLQLGVLVDDAAADLCDVLPELLGRQEAQLAARQFFDEHAGSRRVAVRLILARDRDDVAVADSANLHNLENADWLGLRAPVSSARPRKSLMPSG